MTDTNTDKLIKQLRGRYDKVMHLKIFVDDDKNMELKEKYLDAMQKHNAKLETNNAFIDAGFDLYLPTEQMFYVSDFALGCPINKVDYKIICSAKMETDTILCHGTLISHYDPSGNFINKTMEHTYKSYHTGYYLYPRSSISKLPLRLANSVGIIDSSYRGRIMAMFDVKDKLMGEKHDRYVQICAPGLVPIVVQIVDTLEELGEQTLRGSCGFGSTGK